MISQNLQETFIKNFKWTIFGTFFYESLKLIHQFLLFKFLSPHDYGLVGTTFALIYLTVYISDFGWTNSLTPFADLFIKSKQNFKKIFLKFYFLPQILILLFISFITLYIYKKNYAYPNLDFFLSLLPAIIISESVRIFLRRFLHILFLSKRIILIESFLILFYLSMVWIPYLFLNIKLTQNFIFLTYLADSIIGVICLAFILIKYYKTLDNQPYDHPDGYLKRIIKTRLFNYSTQVGKNFFTGNFLTPFFAIKFGLDSAGISFLANHIAESLKSVLKVTINFSGNALFAKIKTSSIESKKYAFRLLSSKLNLILYPILIFSLLNYNLLINIKNYLNITKATFSLTIIFLFITFIEYFFLLYEQFYILEEETAKLFSFKLIEFLLLFIFIKTNNLISPSRLLLSLAFIKLISFSIISVNAYYTWQIKPTIKIGYKYLLFWVFIAVLFKLFYF